MIYFTLLLVEGIRCAWGNKMRPGLASPVMYKGKKAVQHETSNLHLFSAQKSRFINDIIIRCTSYIPIYESVMRRGISCFLAYVRAKRIFSDRGYLLTRRSVALNGLDSIVAITTTNERIHP